MSCNPTNKGRVDTYFFPSLRPTCDMMNCAFSQLIFNILIELWTAFCVAQINIDHCSTKGGVTSCRSLLLNWDWDQLSKIDHEILWDLIKHKKMIYYIDQFDIPIQPCNIMLICVECNGWSWCNMLIGKLLNTRKCVGCQRVSGQDLATSVSKIGSLCVIDSTHVLSKTLNHEKIIKKQGLHSEYGLAMNILLHTAEC